MSAIANVFKQVDGGFIVAHGTITADKQAWSSTATWNNGAVTFTHTKVNVTATAAAAASMFVDYQLAGASKFSVRKDGQVTAANGLVVSAAGITVTGNSTITGTLTSLTGITSSGTASFAAVTLSGNLTFTSATARIVPGATNFAINNNANNANNLLIADAGAVTFRAGVDGITTLAGTGAISGFTTLTLTAGQGTITLSRNGTGNNNIVIDAASTTSSATVDYQTDGTTKWRVGRGTGDGTNNYILYNSALAAPAITVSSAASVVTLAAGLALSGGTGPSHGIQFGTSAPGSLANGQIWYDGTDFKARTGGATKTFTIT